jgi:hypothetical protein
VSCSEDVVGNSEVGESQLFCLHGIITQDRRIEAYELLGDGDSDFN